MRKIQFYLVAVLFTASVLNAQHQRKALEATRINNEINIDGNLNESVWSFAKKADDFYQFHPFNGNKATEKTEVKVLYDNSGIYIGAVMYDQAPDSILTELGKRDSDDRINADFFSLEINAFNDANIAYEFLISASGVQTDNQNTMTSCNQSWDAVWKSSVNINETGWVAELFIPFSSLRFPSAEIQEWEINFFRKIKRKEEFVSWNYMDKNIQGRLTQAGKLTGLENLSPPLRLSLFPYITSYYEHNSRNSKNGNSFKGGMDIKYGLDESFTIDMMLIPDFGQVQSDDQELNLSAFETYYSEKRQFFTEGANLFNRANIFYSRRIGGMPLNYSNVINMINTEEKVIENPQNKQLINAAKITGRTKDGFGFAFLNAITSNTYAEVQNIVTHEKREIMTDAATNSNVIVMEKAWENNSYISLINTNVFKPKFNYSANVTGTEFKYTSAEQTFSVTGKGALSQHYEKYKNPSYGFYYDLYLSQTIGNFRINLSHKLFDNQFNSNDMGYLTNNNEIANEASIEYNFNKPVYKFVSWNNLLRFRHISMYSPFQFSNSEIYFHSNATLENYDYVFFDLSITPCEKYDFYEPRVPGWKYAEPRAIYIGGGYNTDTKKELSVGFEFGFWIAETNNKKSYWFGTSPKWRVNDKFSINLSLRFNPLFNAIGFVDKSPDNAKIYFGRRDILNFNNILEMKYIVANNLSIDFRVRHYLSSLEYKEFYILQQTGYMDNCKDKSDNLNITYNSLNIDFAVTWQFAPGSEISLVWKNLTDNYENRFIKNYLTNLKNTLESPQINNISLRCLYYVDL